MANITSELTGLRTRNAKHFATDVPGEQVARITTGPQHFLDLNDQWQDMADIVQSVPGGFAATTKDVRFGVENGYLTISRGGKSITMRPTAIAMVDRTAPATRYRKLADANYTNVTRSGNTITVANIFPQTDLTVQITDVVMSKQFVVRQRPNYPDPIALGWNPATTFLVIVWDVTKPNGAVVRDTETLEVFGNGYVGNNDLVVEDGQGQPVVYFKKGEGWSAKANAKHYPVWYVSLGAQVPFGEAFSYEKASIATYPLTLDPTTDIYISSGGSDGYIEKNVDHLAGDYIAYAAYTASVGMPVGSSSSSGDDGKSGVWNYTSYFRCYYRFDLASLSGACTSATLRVYSTTTTQEGVSRTYTAYLHDADWGTLDSGDWDASVTSVGSLSIPNGSIYSYNDFSLSTGAIGAKFGAVAALQQRGYENGTGVNYATVYGSEASGTATDPYLSVTYTVGGSTVSGSFTANAQIVNRLPDGAGVTVDAYIVKQTAASFTADAHVSKTTGGSFTADAWLSAASATTYNGSFTADAHVSKVLSGSLAADSYVKKIDIAGSITANAIISKAYSGSVTADALILKTTAGSVTADAVISKAYAGSLTADSYISSTRSTTFTADSWVQKATSGTFTANANVLRVSSGAWTADAWVKGTPVGSITADANVSKAGIAGSFTSDAWIGQGGAGTFTSNAWIKGIVSGSLSADAIVNRAGIAGSFTANAVISKAYAGSFTANAIVGATRAGSFSADAIVSKAYTGSATADAYVKRVDLAGSFTANAYLSKTANGSLTADSWIKGIKSGTFTSEAWVKGIVAGSFTADATIAALGVVLGSFSADAYVKRADLSGSFIANANISRSFASTFTADGFLKSSVPGTVYTNAWLKGTLLSALTADAHVQRTLSGSFTADTNISNIVTAQFTANGYIKGFVSSGFPADAWINNPNAVKVIIGHATKGIMFRTLQSKVVGYESEPSKTLLTVATVPTRGSTLDTQTNIAGTNLSSKTEKM